LANTNVDCIPLIANNRIKGVYTSCGKQNSCKVAFYIPKGAQLPELARVDVLNFGAGKEDQERAA